MKLNIDAQKLYIMYCVDMMSAQQIADKICVCKHTILDHLKKNGIKTRDNLTALKMAMRRTDVRGKLREQALKQFSDPVKKNKHAVANALAHRTESSRSNARIGTLRALSDPDKLQNIRNGLKKYHKDNVGNTTLGNMQKEIQNRPEVKYKKSIASTAYQNRPDVIETSRKRGKKLWTNSNYAKRVLTGCRQSPNHVELKLLALLNNILPGEYEYTGNGKTPVGSRHPDFTGINNNKNVIELYGRKWHADPDVYSSNDIARYGKTACEIWDMDSKRIQELRDHGKKVLIIWQKEMKDINKLNQKIMEFHKNDDC